MIYCATELAKILGVHFNTIRNWNGRGLPYDYKHGVIFIQHEDVVHFLLNDIKSGDKRYENFYRELIQKLEDVENVKR